MKLFGFIIHLIYVATKEVTMKKGNEYIIEQNLISNYDMYYRLAYSYVHNSSDAMDIVQEGAYKAILKSNLLSKPEYATTWIYRIMINETFSFLRSNKREITDISEIEIPKTDSYVDFDLEKAIDSLDPKDKIIIVLRFFEDYKLEEIAEMVEENLSTVKSRLYRSLKKLKINLAK